MPWSWDREFLQQGRSTIFTNVEDVIIRQQQHWEPQSALCAMYIWLELVNQNCSVFTLYSSMLFKHRAIESSEMIHGEYEKCTILQERGKVLTTPH